MAPLLETRNVRKVFTGGGPFARSRTVALEGLSMSVADGDGEPSFIAIAGESGSGKTTLARLLLGFVRPTSGEVLYRGKEVSRLRGRELKAFRKDVQAIFQDPFEVYNPFYKVDHMLTTPVAKFRLAGRRSVDRRAEARGLIEEALRAVGLRPEETLGRYPHELSGGQRQRITVARALLVRPRLVIADEPVSMVDASLRATILQSLLTLHRDMGISFLYITHDLVTAYHVSRKIVVLYGGTVVEAGDTEAVIEEPGHPYTRELVDSIPVPDPKRRRDPDVASSPAQPGDLHVLPTGCRYAHRCREAMPKCAERMPPLFRTEGGRGVACYLHENPAAETLDGLTAVLSAG